MPTEGIVVLATDSHGTKLRQALVERIKMFRNFNPDIYETCELEDIHDLILDFEDLMWNINKNDTVVSPNHKNLWICSQMSMFGPGKIDWNRATLEQIDRLFNIHEEISEYF